MRKTYLAAKWRVDLYLGLTCTWVNMVVDLKAIQLRVGLPGLNNFETTYK